MRKYEDIVKYIRENSEHDIFGVLWDCTIYLPYTYAKEFLKEGSKEQDWENARSEITEETVTKEIIDYMPFALDKAASHRGLSTGRSLEHFKGWVYMLGNDELVSFIEADKNYAMYGCPILKKICETYGIEYPTSPEMTNMSEGKLCKPNCRG